MKSDCSNKVALIGLESCLSSGRVIYVHENVKQEMFESDKPLTKEFFQKHIESGMIVFGGTYVEVKRLIHGKTVFIKGTNTSVRI